MHARSLKLMLLAALGVFILEGALGTVRLAEAQPRKLAGIGDSISQGYSANDLPGDHADRAFGQGTDATVNSQNTQNLAGNPGFVKQFVSVTGAEMTGGTDNAAAQAMRIC